jgi:threonine/homoserine/homoserine lactone efflux protein
VTGATDVTGVTASAGVFGPAVWIGFSIAAPVGPIGLLVIQRTLLHGRAVGVATGLGAAVADAAYGAVGAFGVIALIGTLQALRVPLALVGGGFLLWLAWRTWPPSWRSSSATATATATAPARESAASPATPSLLASFAGTLLLTLSNPATILSFIAIFGALAGSLRAPASPLLMVAGVLAGSALWWLMLCGAVGALRTHFDARAQAWVGRVSAVMLAGFALWQWLQLLRAVR